MPQEAKIEQLDLLLPLFATDTAVSSKLPRRVVDLAREFYIQFSRVVDNDLEKSGIWYPGEDIYAGWSAGLFKWQTRAGEWHTEGRPSLLYL